MIILNSFYTTIAFMYNRKLIVKQEDDLTVAILKKIENWKANLQNTTQLTNLNKWKITSTPA